MATPNAGATRRKTPIEGLRFPPSGRPRGGQASLGTALCPGAAKLHIDSNPRPHIHAGIGGRRRGHMP